MKILNWYVLKNYLATFGMAIGILTFGLVGAQLMKVFDLLAQGLPVSVAMNALLYFIPHALCFTVPWASLVSIMLVFGRMSADSEITAMRACGVSVLQIVAPLIVTTILFTAVCLQLQFETGPKAEEKARDLLGEVAEEHPLTLFTPGVPVHLDRLQKSASGITLSFSRRDEDNNIFDVRICKADENGIHADAYAPRGRLDVDEERRVMTMTFYDVHFSFRQDQNSRNAIKDDVIFGSNVLGDGAVGDNGGYADEIKAEIDYGQRMKNSRVAQREKYLTVKELLARSVVLKREGEDTTDIEVELSTRVCLALAPIAFLLLGLPLAIRTSRRETSVGLFLSVLLAGIYFANVLCADSLKKEPSIYPQYLIWIVPLLYQAFGIYYMAKQARK